MDKIMVPFVNRLNFISVYWVEKIWDIHIIYCDKVLNIFTVIVNLKFPDWGFTLQFE